MLVDFGKANIIQKARQQPEKVKQVLEKIKTDGLVNTIEAVRSKLDQPLPLGYSNVGVVVDSDVADFAKGDRVVSNGPHADLVCVPKNLCAKIPNGVSDEAAVFTVLSSIGLQGIRLANPSLGEFFVVTGAGLIGLLTIQLLRAQGCRVLAIDYDDTKLQLAKQFGAEICNPGAGEDPVAAGLKFSRGKGVDGVIITASTKSNDPVSQAAQMCRKRGRIILVGVTGLQLNRSDFYEKELSFQVSCSYGPGRYDPTYEDQGVDYPRGFVRWTEQRNFEAVLDLMASGSIDTESLLSHRFPFDDAENAYQLLANDTEALGILLTYAHPETLRHAVTVSTSKMTTESGTAIDRPAVSFVGAGNYASRVLMPAFKKADVSLHTVSSIGGVNSAIAAKSMGFLNATSDTAEMFRNPDIDVAVIATRHNSHAELTCDALNAGKHVFVEKPLAMDLVELEAIVGAYQNAQKQLMVGFNRRFAPHVQIMKKLLEKVNQPKSFVFLMNAGAIPADHWVHNPALGGGRILGESCHHIDLMRFMAGSPITSVSATRMGVNAAEPITEDKAVIVLGFEDGSFGTIHYLANGGSSFPKERFEVFAAGATLQLDNFRSLRGFNWPGFRKNTSYRQDKGQAACAKAFIDAIKHNAPAPIPVDELFEVSRVTIEAVQQLRDQA
jgi:predicted dehydrogenase/threonine dehydrogenase-like Zn-dependent dehydrogenase